MITSSQSSSSNIRKTTQETTSSELPLQNLPDTSETELRVTLIRGNDGYGFNIVGGIDQPHIYNDSGVFISRIRLKGAASVNGQLAVGDKILSINGESCVGVTHQKVLELFHKNKFKVEMVIQPHAESFLRQQYMYQQIQQKKKHGLTWWSTLKFLGNSSIFLAIGYYVCYKAEVIDRYCRLRVPWLQIPSRLFQYFMTIVQR